MKYGCPVDDGGDSIRDFKLLGDEAWQGNDIITQLRNEYKGLGYQTNPV